jgi:hypothetical protein
MTEYTPEIRKAEPGNPDTVLGYDGSGNPEFTTKEELKKPRLESVTDLSAGGPFGAAVIGIPLNYTEVKLVLRDINGDSGGFLSMALESSGISIGINGWIFDNTEPTGGTFTSFGPAIPSINSRFTIGTGGAFNTTTIELFGNDSTAPPLRGPNFKFFGSEHGVVGATASSWGYGQTSGGGNRFVNQIRFTPTTGQFVSGFIEVYGIL